jgi:hypothetical protein
MSFFIAHKRSGTYGFQESAELRNLNEPKTQPKKPRKMYKNAEIQRNS